MLHYAVILEYFVAEILKSFLFAEKSLWTESAVSAFLTKWSSSEPDSTEWLPVPARHTTKQCLSHQQVLGCFRQLGFIHPGTPLPSHTHFLSKYCLKGQNGAWSVLPRQQNVKSVGIPAASYYTYVKASVCLLPFISLRKTAVLTSCFPPPQTYCY